ncbi:hypothetical protein SAMN04489761_4452 [Tenacibaculum sp. MAR_2009_124]|uniref:hypothetical protein n=1 Tax=Tenacibaculum sp. MAR_2009_124 TaxID=1250059 RepID=UPI00089D3A34|nr:hypothetical protein [Tenacibaculum sp. MAR_2009_124]SED15610.1 hypothetical protein SAMN04489761_4452 [Tenacibaculum sp. MAR_2009_124]
MVTKKLNKIIPCIFPIGEECMVSSLAANRLEKQLSYFYPKQHLSYVFEFRVSNEEDQVDLAIAFDQKDDIDFLKEHFPSIYKNIEIQNWLKNCLHLKTTNNNIKSFWLEIDLDGQETTNIPSLFISLTSEAITKTTLEKLVTVLSFQYTDRNSFKMLEICKNALDKGQYIEHIGVMHSRTTNKTTRLYIRGFNKSTLLAYLEKVQWNGNKKLVKEHLNEHHSIEYISVALEFTSVWKPTIGIELHLKKGTQHSDILLSDFIKKEICSTQRTLAIKDILTTNKVSTENYRYRRSLSHFKFTIKNDTAPEYKVYVQLIPSYTSLFGF